MAPTTAAAAPATDPVLDDALLAVELELMRTPALARLNGGRRREISQGVLQALAGSGLLTGIASLETDQPRLRAA